MSLPAHRHTDILYNDYAMQVELQYVRGLSTYYSNVEKKNWYIVHENEAHLLFTYK